MIKNLFSVFFTLILSLSFLHQGVWSQEIEKPLVVILLGPPGSGKGTQAVRVSKALGIPHISTGDLFRENIKNGTDLGKKAKEYVDSGKLAPDDLVIDMLFNRVSQPDAKKGYLLDGFPRTIAQAKSLQKKLDDRVNLIVLSLDVDDEVLVKRITGRLVCQKCGHIHHTQFSPPHSPETCDLCQGLLKQRSDDTEKVVRDRLVVYHEQTKPLINFYKDSSRFYLINGDRSPESVFKDLISKINKNN